MKTRRLGSTHDGAAVPAFTLIEVMIATGIFFMAMFAVLGVWSQSIRAAGSLRNTGPTAGMVAAEFCITNKLERGSDSGGFGDFYADYQWARDVECITNEIGRAHV